MSSLSGKTYAPAVGDSDSDRGGGASPNIQDVGIEMKARDRDEEGNGQAPVRVPLISVHEFEDFYKLVEDDDIEEFKNQDIWPPERRKRYFKGKFNYGDDINHDMSIEKGIFEIPFNLAIGYAAEKIVEEFIYFAVDLMRLEDENINVLHVLVLSSNLNNDRQEDYVKICKLILNHLTPEQFKTLCLQETEDGLRPLELASKLGTYGIFSALLHEPGYICKGKAQLLGMSKVQKYDLSDYQLGGCTKRFLRSPMNYIIFSDEDGVESLSKYQILKTPLVRKWIRYRIGTALPFLLIWWTIRIAYGCMVAFVDPGVIVYDHMCITLRGNTAGSVRITDRTQFEQCAKMKSMTTEQRREMINTQTSIEAFSWLMIVVDVLEVLVCLALTDRRKAYRKQYFITFPSYTRTYRFSQFLLYVCDVLAPIVAKTETGGRAFAFLMFVKAFQLPLCLMSILFIVEFLPIAGIFAITLQKMGKSLIIFLLFLLPVKLIFSKFFTFFASKSGFQSVGEGVYLLFLMDMGAFDFGDTPDILVKVVHVFYFLVMVILLFNYLIAVLSVVADHTSERSRVLIHLRRLQNVLLVEERWSHWLWKLVGKVRGQRPLIFYAQAPRD